MKRYQVEWHDIGYQRTEYYANSELELREWLQERRPEIFPVEILEVASETTQP
jgi:hypothetical protein